MATKKTKKISDLQKVTTASGENMIPVVDANGNVNPIKLSDLAQVVAGLMPVATESSNGLMSAEDKKYGIQHVNFPKNSARKILQIDGAYTQFVIVAFLLSGCSPLNFILSGRSEQSNIDLDIQYKKISDGGQFELYRKENCLYIKNLNIHDPCFGYLISTQAIGTENVTIDDDFTLIG